MTGSHLWEVLQSSAVISTTTAAPACSTSWSRSVFWPRSALTYLFTAVIRLQSIHRWCFWQSGFLLLSSKYFKRYYIWKCAVDLKVNNEGHKKQNFWCLINPQMMEKNIIWEKLKNLFTIIMKVVKCFLKGTSMNSCCSWKVWLAYGCHPHGGTDQDKGFTFWVIRKCAPLYAPTLTVTSMLTDDLVYPFYSYCYCKKWDRESSTFIL